MNPPSPHTRRAGRSGSAKLAPRAVPMPSPMAPNCSRPRFARGSGTCRSANTPYMARPPHDARHVIARVLQGDVLAPGRGQVQILLQYLDISSKKYHTVAQITATRIVCFSGSRPSRILERGTVKSAHVRRSAGAGGGDARA